MASKDSSQHIPTDQKSRKPPRSQMDIESGNNQGFHEGIQRRHEIRDHVSMRSTELVSLQQTLGNRAVVRLLTPTKPSSVARSHHSNHHTINRMTILKTGEQKDILPSIGKLSLKHIATIKEKIEQGLIKLERNEIEAILQRLKQIGDEEILKLQAEILELEIQELEDEIKEDEEKEKATALKSKMKVAAPFFPPNYKFTAKDIDDLAKDDHLTLGNARPMGVNVNLEKGTSYSQNYAFDLIFKNKTIAVMHLHFNTDDRTKVSRANLGASDLKESDYAKGKLAYYAPNVLIDLAIAKI